MVKILLGNLKDLFSPFFALKDHAHGLITKDGTISGQASKNVVTDANGKITTEAKPTIPTKTSQLTNDSNYINNFDRLINGSQITAGEALTANTLVYARNNGRYYKVASGGTLDIRYPVIYNNQAIASGNNHYNNHNAYNAGVNIQNTLSGKTITAYQNCYLEGKLTGNTFTISSNVFVSDGATVKGKYYILLGMALSTTLIRFNSFDKVVYKCIDNNHTLIPFTNMKGVITTGSLDDVTMTGWYSYSGTDSNNITNVPEKVGSVMEVLDDYGDGTYVVQKVYPIRGDKLQIIYYRVKYSANGWSSWIRIDGGDKAPASHTHHDNSITWDSSAVGTTTSLDFAVNNQINANRLNFLPPANISISYSTNNSTYTDYGATNDQKIGLVTDTYDWQSIAYASGKGATASANNTLRVEINAGGVSNSQDSNLYCKIKKCMIAFSTAGATNCKVLVEKRIYGETTYSTVGTFNLEGYWGWNSFSLNNLVFGAYKSQMTSSAAHVQYLRFTFSSSGNANFQLKGIRFYGDPCWVAPSQYAKDSQLGAIGRGQDVTFPAKIIKRGGTNTQLLLANGDTKPTTDFATDEHTHNYSPNNHASTATTYGVGTTSNYGHNKIIDDATKSSLTNGESLSAHMGYVLNNQDVEYVVSTHTSSTSTWTGTCSELRKLQRGTKIYYRLNQDPTTTDVTLNLTLADSTTTGAKSVYFGGTRLKNQYPKYAVIGMVYDGSNWIVINQYTNTNTTYSADESTLTKSSSNVFSLKDSSSYVKTSDSRLSNARTPIFNHLGASKDTPKDLNTFQTGGFYYCNHDTNQAPYVTNCPISPNTHCFFLLVESWGTTSTAYTKQTLTYYNDNTTYIRTCASGTWTSWRRIDGGDKASTSHTHDDRYFTESEINTKFGWTTVATTSLGGGTQKLDVNSTLRLANYYGNVSVAVTANITQLGTLTSGYFPSKTVRQPAHNLTANPIWIIVTNDGKISYRGSTASNGNLTLDWDMFWRY